jgi:hypothetical protein
VTWQQWPALPFVLVGSAMVLVVLHREQRIGTRAVRMILALWALFLAGVAFIGLPEVPRNYLSVDASAASALSRIHHEVPPNAKVIVSQGVSGRFADIARLQTFWYPGQSFPINARTVVFIVTATQGMDEVSPSTARRATLAIGQLGARTLASQDGIDAFEWSVRNQHNVVLP